MTALRQDHTTHEASRLANARVAGLLYLVISVFGLFSEAVRQRTLVPGDAAATAENILDAEALFRIAFVATVLYLVAEVVMTVILYVLLRPVNRTLSLTAAALRLVMLAFFAANLLHMYAALLILRRADGPELRLFAPFYLELHRFGYALGLTFFAANCVVMGILLIRSSHAPTGLGGLLAVAGLGYLTNSLVWFLVPDYGGGVAMAVLLIPALVAEIWFCLLLIRTGGGIREWAEPGRDAG
jgi:Domain of unknown function (DUF4386)